MPPSPSTAVKGVPREARWTWSRWRLSSGARIKRSAATAPGSTQKTVSGRRPVDAPLPVRSARFFIERRTPRRGGLGLRELLELLEQLLRAIGELRRRRDDDADEEVSARRAAEALDALPAKAKQ